MTNTIKIKSYQKEFAYSYTSGAYATIELLKTAPKLLDCVYVHSQYRDIDGITALCKAKEVPCIRSDKAFSSVNQKENSYVLGVFRKYVNTLWDNEPHVVLVNPSDMGNLGTIIRTITGMNVKNLAVIEPAADIWHPKTIRASMGALFHIRHASFHSFEEYAKAYPKHEIFPFMLEGEYAPEQITPHNLFTLVFGNEATGLDARFRQMEHSVKIPLTDKIDSFNLASAVSIGTYVFARKNGLI
ncbi:MAG TPA: TrmH family RNA methyltransferase [Oscillospiraceae bacterium]|nr:TrmH family RNA methyltransferase [Oscillospiraceae bacterium]HPF56204.1 TrmH family RNA methyltransferase [Clostridiales bacterium]HPK36187.1 TrmH family RNA methyltransferase [Oscillospiraceae bacterium]HPR76225.1 TrmH family RNA methyltransferase [Oscillospiraceae bacterium]